MRLKHKQINVYRLKTHVTPPLAVEGERGCLRQSLTPLQSDVTIGGLQECRVLLAEEGRHETSLSRLSTREKSLQRLRERTMKKQQTDAQKRRDRRPVKFTPVHACSRCGVKRVVTVQEERQAARLRCFECGGPMNRISQT